MICRTQNSADPKNRVNEKKPSGGSGVTLKLVLLD